LTVTIQRERGRTCQGEICDKGPLVEQRLQKGKAPRLTLDDRISPVDDVHIIEQSENAGSIGDDVFFVTVASMSQR